jgi:hypothetical protein
MPCLAIDCERRILARGLCGLHYKRFMRGEDINSIEKFNQSIPRGGLAALGLHKHHPFYLAWVNMKTRCDNPKSTSWKYYGGRGIWYQDSWQQFSEFHKDMWDDWYEGASLDRELNHLGYSKLNCRWIPLSEQAKNRRPRGSV